ncbi:MAG: outer membrane beta-barrel family protein [Chitinophagaceae bacterium]
MRKAYLLALFLIAIAIAASAQKNGSIKGIAFDTLGKQAVPSATITVLDKKDSSLITFTMTDNLGGFELRGIPNGDYRLLISHVNYHNSNTFFTISDSAKSLDLGSITLNDKNKVLEEVVLNSEAPPVTMIGDTIQYNAGSFKTIPNANVEQLLKKLPGVKVDKDGKITAQGEKVNRVLVDGKEFFGNDPKIATRNLPADAIDKVQVYDKQSDQAQLTGFDDGNYEKTINLKLKKDKKKGVFGKVNAGGGTDDRYEGRFNVNSFKGARQMSAIGMANNTNAEGFTFTDILSFTGALNQMKQGGSFTINGDEAAALGLGNNLNGGINTTWAGGLNYNNVFGDKLDWQSNYFFNRYNPHSTSRVLRQNFLPGSTNFYEQNAVSDNLSNSHRMNINALYQIDSFHSLRINPSLSYQQNDNNSVSDSRTRAENGDMINDAVSDSRSSRDGYTFRNELVFRKKFRQKGRTFSISLQNSLNESNGDGDLQSMIGYYNAGSLYRRDTLNQRNTTNGDMRGYSARAVYTEPLWRRSLLEFSLGRSNTENTSNKTTYDYNKVSGKYDKLNTQLTNDFENTYSYTNGGIRLRTQRRNYNYSVGLTVQQAELEGKVTSGVKDSLITKRFRNLLPTASFQYNISKFKSASLQYMTNTNQPTMAQLQPVPDVTNPLYIREGNPNLKQEFSHLLRTNLNLVSPFTNKNFFFNAALMATQNKIVNYDSVNALTGVRKTKPVNVNGVYNLNGSISYSRPVRFLKGTVELSSNFGYNRGKQFINTIGNNIKTMSMGPELRFDLNPTDQLNLGLSAAYNYTRTTYSLQSALNNTYLSQEYNTSADWQLPKNFFLSTSLVYTVNTQRAAGFNVEVPLWNASLSKQFLKYNRGEIKLSAFDLLNRNTGITRNTSQNYIEDREVNTIRRYFLLNFTYSLTKSGLGNGVQVGTIRMR